MKNIRILFKTFFMFLVGYCTYMAMEMTFRSYTFVLMGIVGGISFILIDSINNKLSFNVDILIQCITGSSIITIFELIVGRCLQILHYPEMWNYLNMPLNYKGVICLPFSLLWCIVSLFAILLADSINYYIFHMNPRPYYKLFGKIIFQLPKRKCTL